MFKIPVDAGIDMMITVKTPDGAAKALLLNQSIKVLYVAQPCN